MSGQLVPRWVELQFTPRFLLIVVFLVFATVKYLDCLVAERSWVSDPIPSFDCLFHSTFDVAGHVFGEEFVEACDHVSHQSPRCADKHGFHDRNHFDPMFFEQIPVPDHIFEVSREPVEFPDDDRVERRVRRCAVLDHFLEPRPVGDSAGFCFVYVLLDNKSPSRDGVIFRH